jgi:hypothetical protein
MAAVKDCSKAAAAVCSAGLLGVWQGAKVAEAGGAAPVLWAGNTLLATCVAVQHCPQSALHSLQQQQGAHLQPVGLYEVFRLPHLIRLRI